MRVVRLFSGSNPSAARKHNTHSPMKTIKPIVAATIAATLASSAAFADDQQLQTRLALQRAQMEKTRQTTIALYAGKGIGESAVRESRTQTRLERHVTGHDTHYVYRASR